MGWVVLGGVLLVVLLAAIVVYNQLVRAKVAVRQAWAQVDAQLQRRHDLLPQITATVKGYLPHEQDLLDEVTRARSHAIATDDLIARQGAEDQFGEALQRLLARAESHPDLRADIGFRALQSELATTEERIAFARGFANDRVTRYRKLTDTLPGLLIARPFRMPREALFSLESERAGQAPSTPAEGGWS